MEWYVKCMQNYANFEGRARRKEYWMFTLFNVIFAIAAGVLDAVTGLGFLVILYSLATLVPGIAVAIRRLHDIGKPGIWILIALVPFIGGIWLLILMATEGQRGENAFGSDPKGGSSEMPAY